MKTYFKKALHKAFLRYLPLVCVGTVLFVLGWAVGSLTLSFIAVLTVLVSGGLIGTNLVYGWEELVIQSIRDEKISKTQKLNKDLDWLDHKLRQDKDPRDQDCLRSLRAYYQLFIDALENKQISPTTEIVAQMEKVFHDCVVHLRQVFDFWDKSRNLPDKQRKALLAQREASLLKAQELLDIFAKSFEGLQNLATEKPQKTHENLLDQIEIARRVKDQLRGIDEKDYSEYQ